MSSEPTAEMELIDNLQGAIRAIGRSLEEHAACDNDIDYPCRFYQEILAIYVRAAPLYRPCPHGWTGSHCDDAPINRAQADAPQSVTRRRPSGDTME